MIRLRRQGTIENMVVEFYSYVEQSRAWFNDARADFMLDIQRARDVITENVKERKEEYESIKHSLGLVYGKHRVEELFKLISNTWVAQRARAAMNAVGDWDTFNGMFSRAIVDRLMKIGQGHRRTLDIVTGDVEYAKRLRKNDRYYPVTFEELRGLGLEISRQRHHSLKGMHETLS